MGIEVFHRLGVAMLSSGALASLVAGIQAHKSCLLFLHRTHRIFVDCLGERLMIIQSHLLDDRRNAQRARQRLRLCDLAGHATHRCGAWNLEIIPKEQQSSGCAGLTGLLSGRLEYAARPSGLCWGCGADEIPPGLADYLPFGDFQSDAAASTNGTWRVRV